MPTLILSSRFTTDSQVLRGTARRLGWETLRLDGTRLPGWFDPPDPQIALYYTAPHAFEVARQLSRTLLGCDPGWILRLPHQYVQRTIELSTIAKARQRTGKWFAKHALAKAFPAGIYDRDSLAAATDRLAPTAIVLVCEIVDWIREYRCFVLEGEVVAVGAYRRDGRTIEGHTDAIGATSEELAAARAFASNVLRSIRSDAPPAFVMDVGVMRDRGWGVVEHNECWASGIYTCDPEQVLRTLRRSCPASRELTPEDRRWDFRAHYAVACP